MAEEEKQKIEFDNDKFGQLIERIIAETKENRDKALSIFDTMAAKMSENDGNLIMLGQNADRYLDQATKTTAELVKVAAVYTRLAVFKKMKDEGKNISDDFFTDVLGIIHSLPGNSPFERDNTQKQIEKPELKQIEEKNSNLFERVNNEEDKKEKQVIEQKTEDKVTQEKEANKEAIKSL